MLMSAMLMAAAVYASGLYSVRLNGSSRIWVEGDSSMHAYKSTSSVVNMKTYGTLNVQPDSLTQLAVDKKFAPYIDDLFKNMKVSIDVTSFRSPTPGFDSKFYETLKADSHPEIAFKPSTYKITKDKNSSDLFILSMDGVVRVAGKEKAISLTSHVKILGDKAVISGQKELFMTDFGIKPPELLFVKTDNRVVVKWNINVSMVPGNQ